jgi:hypothetical protein
VNRIAPDGEYLAKGRPDPLSAEGGWHMDTRSGSTRGRAAADLVAPAAFSWDLAADQWWWSPGMYRLYGYETNAVTPGLALLLVHQHPNDRERMEQALRRTRRDGRPFTFEHRIVTAGKQLRTVILSVQTELGSDGRPELVSGISLDVSQARRLHHAAADETVSGLQAQLSRLSRAAEARGVINQAIGILVERHRFTAEQATALLRGASQVACRNLADIASELVFTGKLPAGSLTCLQLTERRPPGRQSAADLDAQIG